MLNLPIYEADDLYKHGLALLERELPLNLRLMGLRMTHLCPRGKPHGDLDKVLQCGQAADLVLLRYKRGRCTHSRIAKEKS